MATDHIATSNIEGQNFKMHFSFGSKTCQNIST